MSGGLETTLKLLSETGNEAATGVLVRALDAPCAEIQQGAVSAIFQRRSVSGQQVLLRRWETLEPKWKEIAKSHPGRMSRLVRDAILSSDSVECTNGCAAAVDLGEYDLTSALINAAEDSSNPNADVVSRTLIDLAERLFEDVAKRRTSGRGRDPHMMRRHALSSLEESTARYIKHRRQEVLEAFLLLARKDNAALRRILQNPHDSCFLPFVDILTHSKRPGIIRLVLSFLEDPQAPSAAIQLLSRRDDEPFLRHLLAKIGYEPTKAACANLKRMSSVQWLRGDLELLKRLTDEELHSAVQLVMATGMNRLEAFEVVRHVIHGTSTPGRRAAANALAQFRGSEANQLVVEMLDDPDPQVRANVLLQLRERGIPSAMKHLLEALNSSHEELREASRKCLPEFNIRRYLSAFDMLEETVRVSTGILVMKVDPTAVPTLLEELACAARVRRLRAIGAAAAMNAVSQLQEKIVELLQDDDHFIRAEAALALAKSDSDGARLALRDSLMDRSLMVQEAAERALRLLSNSATTKLARPEVSDSHIELPSR